MGMTESERVEIIRLALLASYNTTKSGKRRCERDIICNEDADPIWAERAKSVLRDLRIAEAVERR